MRNLVSLFLLFICYLFFMGDLYANTIKKVSVNKPIKIEADEVKIQTDNDKIIFTGKVKITQDELNIFADSMVVNYYKNKKKDAIISNIKANDNVILKNKTITAKGDSAFYDFKNQIVTLKDNIILNEEDAVVLGDILTYNIETQETKIGSKNEEKTVGNIENIDTIKENNNKNKKRVIIILDNINNIKDRYDGD